MSHRRIPRSYSGGAASSGVRRKARAASGNAASSTRSSGVANGIRLRSGSAGHYPLETDDQEHEPIEVRKRSQSLDLLPCFHIFILSFLRRKSNPARLAWWIHTRFASSSRPRPTSSTRRRTTTRTNEGDGKTNWYIGETSSFGRKRMPSRNVL